MFIGWYGVLVVATNWCLLVVVNWCLLVAEVCLSCGFDVRGRASVLLCCRGFGLLLLRFEALGFARFWFLGLGLAWV